MKSLYIATKDALSEAVAEQLVTEANHGLQVVVRMRQGGYGYLKKKLPSMVTLAANIPVFMLTDLDRQECAPSLVSSWLGEREKPEGLLFRVAVREIEAWLLADRQGFAQFSGAPETQVPQEPETLTDPKQRLLSLVRRYAPRELRNEIVRQHKGAVAMGLSYNARLVQFVQSGWSLQRAAANADSLARALRCICDLAKRQA